MKCPMVVKIALFGKPYHFESSKGYIEEDKINKVFKKVKESRPWAKPELYQLGELKKLEKLRYNLAKKKIKLKDYRNKITAIDKGFYKKFDADIFMDSSIHNAFYDAINEK